MTLKTSVLSLISNEVRIGSSVRLITLPTIMIYRNTRE